MELLDGSLSLSSWSSLALAKQPCHSWRGARTPLLPSRPRSHQEAGDVLPPAPPPTREGASLSLVSNLAFTAPVLRDSGRDCKTLLTFCYEGARLRNFPQTPGRSLVLGVGAHAEAGAQHPRVSASSCS